MLAKLTQDARIRVVAFLVAVILVFIWRRPVEWHQPYPWVEEGTVSLPAYLSMGWRSLWDPVSGYLVLPAKFIFLTAVSLSAYHYPQIAYALTVVFEVGTLALLAFSPSHLRFPWLAAFFVAVIPTQPEVFAVSEYAFWWGTLWSFVALFWREGAHPRTAWRCVLAIMGGLSSPIAIPIAVLFAGRLAATRRRSDAWVLATGVSTAAVQAWMIHVSTTPLGIGNRSVDLVQVVIRFFGHFVVSTPNAPFVVLFGAGLAILAWVAWFAVTHEKWKDPWFLLLGASLGAGIVASLSRVSVEMIHPVGAARYFFYPYAFLGWLLLYTYAEAGRRARGFVAVVLLLAFSQFAMHGRQQYETYDWHAELSQCIGAGASPRAIPVQFNGDKTIAWHVSLTDTQCQALVGRSLFR